MAKIDPQARLDADSGLTDIMVARTSGAAPRPARSSHSVDRQGAGNIIHMNAKKNGAASSAAAKGPSAPGAERDRARVSDHIGRQLRGMYDGLLNQPVPDRFMELVKQLEGRDANGGDRTS